MLSLFADAFFGILPVPPLSVISSISYLINYLCWVLSSSLMAIYACRIFT